MYEERTVDVASYVCKILDEMPTSPSSPMYVDWHEAQESVGLNICFITEQQY